MKRGEFLSTTAAFLFTACTAPQKLFDPTPVPRSRARQELALRHDQYIPGEYSDIVKQYNLIPQEFGKDQDWRERIARTIHYLERYHAALQNNPQLRGEPVSAYGVTSSNNYPLAIENDWTVWHVVDEFFRQLDDKKTSIDYGAKSTHLAELQGGVVAREKDVRFESEVVFEEILTAELSFTEPNDYKYSYITDAEAAVLGMHEFAHALQAEAIFRKVTAGQNLQFDIREQRWREESRFQSLMEREIPNQFDRVKKEVERAGLPTDIAQHVQVAEAQANTVAYLFLRSLNQINGSRYFPGTRLTDPLPETVREFQKNVDPNFINLYEQFLNTVVASRNAMHPEWLRYAAPTR